MRIAPIMAEPDPEPPQRRRRLPAWAAPVAIGFIFGALTLAAGWRLALQFELRDLILVLAPLVTAVSVWVAITQVTRTRVRVERDTARTAGIAGYEALRLVASRLRPRFNPMLQEIEGQTMRGARSAEMVEVVKEIKVTELPETLVHPYLQMRAALVALTQAMDETPWPDPKRVSFTREQLAALVRYRAAYVPGREAYDTYRERLLELSGQRLDPVAWDPPEPGTIELQVKPVLFK